MYDVPIGIPACIQITVIEHSNNNINDINHVLPFSLID